MAIIAKVYLYRWNAAVPDQAKEYILNPTTPVYNLATDPMTFTPDGSPSQSRGKNEYTIVVEDNGVPIATSSNTPDPPRPIVVPNSEYNDIHGALKKRFITYAAGSSGTLAITADTVIDYQTSIIADTSIVTVNGAGTEFTCQKAGKYEITAITNGEIDYVLFGLESSLESYISVSTGGAFSRINRSTGSNCAKNLASGDNKRNIQMVSYLLVNDAVAGVTKYRVNCNKFGDNGKVYRNYSSINIKYLGI